MRGRSLAKWGNPLGGRAASSDFADASSIRKRKREASAQFGEAGSSLLLEAELPRLPPWGRHGVPFQPAASPSKIPRPILGRLAILLPILALQPPCSRKCTPPQRPTIDWKSIDIFRNLAITSLFSRNLHSNIFFPRERKQTSKLDILKGQLC